MLVYSTSATNATGNCIVEGAAQLKAVSNTDENLETNSYLRGKVRAVVLGNRARYAEYAAACSWQGRDRGSLAGEEEPACPINIIKRQSENV